MVAALLSVCFWTQLKVLVIICEILCLLGLFTYGIIFFSYTVDLLYGLSIKYAEDLLLTGRLNKVEWVFCSVTVL